MGLNYRLDLVSLGWRQVPNPSKLDPISPYLPAIQVFHKELSNQHIQRDLTVAIPTQRPNERALEESGLKLLSFDQSQNLRPADCVLRGLQKTYPVWIVYELVLTLKSRHVHLLFRLPGTFQHVKRLAQSSSEEAMCNIFQDHRLKVQKHQEVASNIHFPSLRAYYQNLRVRQCQTEPITNNQSITKEESRNRSYQ